MTSSHPSKKFHAKEKRETSTVAHLGAAQSIYSIWDGADCEIAVQTQEDLKGALSSGISSLAESDSYFEVETPQKIWIRDKIRSETKGQGEKEDSSGSIEVFSSRHNG